MSLAVHARETLLRVLNGTANELADLKNDFAAKSSEHANELSAKNLELARCQEAVQRERESMKLTQDELLFEKSRRDEQKQDVERSTEILKRRHILALQYLWSLCYKRYWGSDL